MPDWIKKSSIGSFERMINEGNNMNLICLHQYELNEDSFTLTTPMTKNIQSWKAVVKVGENEDYYFLYDTALSAFIIPKIAVGSKRNNFHKYFEKIQNN